MDREAPGAFPRQYRIVRSTDYRAAYEGGRKVYRKHFTLFAFANSLGHHRLGITVTRKVGGAVVRNRIKRLFRELFRRAEAAIPQSFDFVVNARPGAGEAGYDALREEFLGAADEAMRAPAQRPRMGGDGESGDGAR